MKKYIQTILVTSILLISNQMLLEAQYVVTRATWENRIGGSFQERDIEFDLITVGGNNSFNFSNVQNLEVYDDLEASIVAAASVDGNERFPTADAAIIISFEEGESSSEIRSFIRITDSFIAGEGTIVNTTTGSESFNFVSEYAQKQPLEFYSGTQNETTTVVDTLLSLDSSGNLEDYTVYITDHTYKGAVTLALPGESAQEASMWYIAEQERYFDESGSLISDETFYYLRIQYPEGSVELDLSQPYTDQPVQVSSLYQIKFSDSNTSVEESNLPQEFKLHGNYPNPFNPTTNISFELAQSQQVQLQVFNVMGNEVYQSATQVYSPGAHQLRFDASNLPGGVYLYRLQAGNQILSSKMTLVK